MTTANRAAVDPATARRETRVVIERWLPEAQEDLDSLLRLGHGETGE